MSTKSEIIDILCLSMEADLNDINSSFRKRLESGTLMKSLRDQRKKWERIFSLANQMPDEPVQIAAKAHV